MMRLLPVLQDIIGITSYDWPERFYKLDARYNWRWQSGRDFSPATWGSEPGICVEHFTNGGFGDKCDGGNGRGSLVAYWRDYRRIAPGSAPHKVRGSGRPLVPWHWEYGKGRSLGPLRKN
jgi:hypothetical protein